MSQTANVDETLPGEVARRDTAKEPSKGEVIGRYVVLSKVGEGGMGVVYAAYDPDLDRKVALKLMRPQMGGAGSLGASRLLREAQALGKLSHPNVVAVHDVGTRNDEVWVAMEFIDGQTFGAWREQAPRSWREVLDVLRPAALGLAAAHDAGLVHRDVKPDNIMLEARPNESFSEQTVRVRVMDFGLARGAQADDEDTGCGASRDTDESTHRKPNPLDLDLTRMGATLGTPAYMAPEQIAGRKTGARTDQFSFCVMMWEALYEQRPFEGDTVASMTTAIVENNLRPPPRGAAVPRWLRMVLHRGLDPSPDKRWPSLAALLCAIEGGQRRGRLYRGLAVVGLAGLVVAGGWGKERFDELSAVTACEESGAQIDAVWNDTDREAVRAGLRSTGVTHADVTADKVMPWLDAQARAWKASRTATCLDANVHGRWDADVHDRSTWCLEERRLALGALVARLSDAGPEAVSRAVGAVSGLRRVEPCRDEALLSRLPAPPTEDLDRVEQVRAELSRAAALEATGQYAEGLSVARSALEHAEATGWPPLRATARRRIGRLLEKTGEYADAEATVEQAYFEAARAGATEDALEAALALVRIVGVRQARPSEGQWWAKHAEYLRSMLPDPAGLREANSLEKLALVQQAAGEYEEAASLSARALQIKEEALGPDHLDVATLLNNISASHVALGAYDEAAQLQGRALAIRERALGSEHPEVAMSLHNIGAIKTSMGSHEEAAELLSRAIAIRERVLGPEHPEVANSLNNLAVVRRRLGVTEEAATLHERALAIRERALGPTHPGVAESLLNLGNVKQSMGAYEEAAAALTRALDILEASLGPEHPRVASALQALALLALEQRRSSDAVTWAQRSLKIREETEVAPTDIASIRFVLARALVDSGGSKARVVELCAQARAVYFEEGESERQMVAEIDAFLREYAAP